MDAKQFLAEFRHIVSAPCGVQRVRELILQLAISGNLSQDSVESVEGASARDAFEANRAAQLELAPLGRSKRKSPPRPVEPSEVPWNVPSSWMWCRLGDLTNYGQAPKAEFRDVKSTTWVLELEDIEKGTSRLLQRVQAGARGFHSTKNVFTRGAVLYSKLRPYLDKVLIADEDGVCSTEIVPISFFYGIEAAYLRWYLKSPFFIRYASKSTHGMNLPRLGTDAAREALFPLPPPTAQKLIVAKVDELMALCNKLEDQQEQRQKLCTTSRITIFRDLGNALTPADLATAWRRVANNAPALLDSPESVLSYRDAILDLAMRGALLPLFERRSASGQKLLLEIDRRRLAWSSSAAGQELKEALAMQRKVRTQQRVQIDSPIPKHWEWASILRISKAVVDCHNKTAPYLPQGIHIVRTTDIRNGRLDLMHTRKVSAATYAFWARRLPPEEGDVIFTREAPMGEAAIVPPGERVCLG